MKGKKQKNNQEEIYDSEVYEATKTKDGILIRKKGIAKDKLSKKTIQEIKKARKRISKGKYILEEAKKILFENKGIEK